MILNGIEELQKLLPSINLRLDSNRLEDFMSRAQDWVTDEIIGSDLKDILEIDILPNAPDEHEKLRLLVKRVIAAKAYLMFGDEMNLQLGEAGMTVQHNSDMAAASVQRRDNLMNSLEERLDHDCDALVNYLLKNSISTDDESTAPYEDWRKTAQFAYLTIAFLPTLKELRHHVPFKADYSDHWEAFKNSLLKMSVVMFDVAAPYLSMAEIVRLRDLYRDNDLSELQLQAVFVLQDVAAACLVDDIGKARTSAINARAIIMKDLEEFPNFAESSCFTLPDVSFNAGLIVDTL